MKPKRMPLLTLLVSLMSRGSALQNTVTRRDSGVGWAKLANEHVNEVLR
jgi:hypothetical protein